MATFKSISVVELAADFSADKPPVVYDVRDQRSFGAGHVAGAVRLDNQSAQALIAAADKSAKTVVCCYHGNSSKGAAQFLAEQGFTAVYSLDGGVTQWALSQPCERS